MSFDSRIRARIAYNIHKVGKQMTYRRVTKSSGPNPKLNPPLAVAPTVNGNFLTGVSAIDFDEVSGRVVPGDKFTISGDATVYTITNTVDDDDSDRLINVKFTPALAKDAADGTAVTFTWAADTQISARVMSYPMNQVDGDNIRLTDLMILIAGTDIDFTPMPGDNILINSDVIQVLSARPNYVKEMVGDWQVQGRK